MSAREKILGAESHAANWGVPVAARFIGLR